VALHYTVLTETMLIFSFIFLESVKFIAIFLVCFYYFVGATDYLPNKKAWACGLRVCMLIGVVVEVLGLVILCLYQGLASSASSKLCMDPVFLVLRAGGELMTLLFFVIGVTITRKVLTQQRKTTFEKTRLRLEQMKALRSLW
jgi:hypothetical protein